MMIYKLIPPVLLLLLTIGPAVAQESKKYDIPAEKNKNFAIVGHTSTNGLGANLVYSFTEKLMVRAGYEKLKFNLGFDFNEDDITYDANLDYKTGSISVLADYYLFRNVYLTGGLGFHLFNPYLEGEAARDWKYGDIYISPEDIGDFRFSFEPSLRIAPYAGLGFGRNMALEKKVAFHIETGFFYLGKPDVAIEATGLLSPTADPAHGQEELFEEQLEKYRFYPVIKFGISVKLF